MKKSYAVRLFKTKSKLARALEISRNAVGQWKKEIPPLREYQIREIMKKEK